jgi:hypothetical protein
MDNKPSGRNPVKPHKRYANNICAYCGSSDNLDDDHIPPKNLFPKPRPHNLITVKACPKCHSNTSKDDEYFRLKISMRDSVGSNPVARETWNTVFRSLSRTKATGLRKKVISDTIIVDVKTKSGIFLGKRLGYNVDMDRIRKVVQRIVRGLYFIESGNPLGINNEVRVWVEEDLQEQPLKVLQQFQETIFKPLATLSPKIIGNNVFIYRYQITKENPLVSIWLMSFYEHIPFLAITAPTNF